MAPRKGKETPLELCTRTTILGNTISVRMLEYLSTAKSLPHGFRELATDFLDICRILWSIEAGLVDIKDRHRTFPTDMMQELNKKFGQTHDDFIVLNHMVNKFLEQETKGGFGKLQKGWRMMFADTDIQKMRDHLAKTREALRMSAAVFRWSLGDAKADASVGIGYTGLVAALDRMNQTRPTTVIPPLQHPAMNPPELPPPSQLPLPPTLPPMSPIDRRSEASIHTPPPPPPRDDDDGESIIALPQIRDHQAFVGRASSTRSSEYTSHSIARDSVLPKNQFIHPDLAVEDDLSDKTLTSKTLLDELQEMDLNAKFSNQVIRLKADPSAVPRWSPRQTVGANSASLRTSLINAVQQRKHKMIEQLLDSGVRPDGGMEINILREAVVNRDPDSVRLLLVFGADPNGFDKDGFTPLFSATEGSFLEGAKMLIKYGADPNLSAGADSESPFALAVTENKLDFVQLYLMYGGDANFVMASGNTVLIKAMNKTTPKKLVELMLNYGSDPNGKNSEGKTALFEAISSSRIDLITTLLDHGANPNLPGPKHMLWPSTYQPKALQVLLARGADHTKCSGVMELAASINNIESVSILLKAGASPNAKKDGTYTPLCSAIRDNRGEIVSLLLANGADPNLKASEYPAFKCVTHHRVQFLPQLVAAGADLHTPKGILEKAVAHNNKEALMYLLNEGVNPNDRSPEGGATPLTTAIRDDRGEFVDILLANGADPAIRGQDWPICMAVKRPEILKKLLPALHNPRATKGVVEMAVHANQLESVKLLLNAGVSVEDKNGGVFSPLTTALREERKDIVRYLLDVAGADPNAPGEHLPIVKALRRYNGSDTDFLEMLLAKGADINKMYRGWNGVLQAVENGDAAILKLLIEKGGGVNLEVTDDSGKPVIDIVTERGWEEAVTLLLSNGLTQAQQ